MLCWAVTRPKRAVRVTIPALRGENSPVDDTVPSVVVHWMDPDRGLPSMSTRVVLNCTLLSAVVWLAPLIRTSNTLV